MTREERLDRRRLLLVDPHPQLVILDVGLEGVALQLGGVARELGRVALHEGVARGEEGSVLGGRVGEGRGGQERGEEHEKA
jgi:hypothetical protein